jgi:hypothetical protein
MTLIIRPNNLKFLHMTKYICIAFTTVFFSFLTNNASAQFKLPFGKVTVADLSNKPYKPDPGADAIVLSETGVASLQYQEGFYVDFEKNVKIRIVNSNGYDYANIEIPFDIDDKMDSYKASTFNLRNGEKIETEIPKNSFILEKTSKSYNTLKFNFPDVHEGSVIEYSYKMRLFNGAIAGLVSWQFQHGIPVESSSLTVTYPDAFVYKSLISGSSKDVQTDFSKSKTNFFGEYVSASVNTWLSANVPAFRREPYILSEKEHLTKVTFELARVDFPNITLNDISPTYERLNTKLLDREDFGTAINTNFKSLASQISSGSSDELAKLKKIHAYVSTKVLWNGIEDFTANYALRNILNKEKGSSADINLILIAILRSAGLKADPVILCTRSNGSLNQNSAMLQQFNYVVAEVSADGKDYLVDATDPIRPFNLLPFECLNGTGRLISTTNSRFIELKNGEKNSRAYVFTLSLDKNGDIIGNFKNTLSDYPAFDVRKLVVLESEEGYLDMVRSKSPDVEFSNFRIIGLKDQSSDLKIESDIKIIKGAQLAGNRMIVKQVIPAEDSKNPFYSEERKFPVNFGCPVSQIYSLTLSIPEGYVVAEKPADATFIAGNDWGKFAYSCIANGNEVKINYAFDISKTLFEPSDYTQLRSFYAKAYHKMDELIILEKNPVTR